MRWLRQLQVMDFAQEKLWHLILVRLTVDSDKGRQAGNGWHGVIVVDGSHGEGVF